MFCRVVLFHRLYCRQVLSGNTRVIENTLGEFRHYAISNNTHEADQFLYSLNNIPTPGSALILRDIDS
jgi:hypothetical protein